jgi:uncharacterized membrane protein
MKKNICVFLVVLMHARLLVAADVKSVATFLDNLKYFVVRMMTATVTSPATKSTFTAVNPTLQTLIKQGQTEAVNKQKPVVWSESLKQVVASIKPKTDMYIGGAIYDGKEVKFQPGIIMALLNMVASLPGSMPNNEGLSGVRSTLNTVAPTASSWGGQVRTLTLRLTCIFNVISSVQKMLESFFSPDILSSADQKQKDAA